MVVKVYVSGISASKEVKKRQQRVLLILDSAQVDYEQVDVTEPGREEERHLLQSQWKVRTENGNPLPPQFFSDEIYLGDYDDFNSAVDINDIYTFLRLPNRGGEKVKETIAAEVIAQPVVNQEIITNGTTEEKPNEEENRDIDTTEDVDEHQADITEVVKEEEVIRIEKSEDAPEAEIEPEVPTEEKEIEEVKITEVEAQPEQVSESSSDNEEEEDE